jgi:hypothetical protein
MEDEEGAPIAKANPGMQVVLKTNPALPEAVVNGILRRQKRSSSEQT